MQININDDYDFKGEEMKTKWKRIVAMLCIVTLLGGNFLTGNMQTVQADSTSVSARQTKMVSYTNAVPGVAPTDIPEGYIFAGWYQKADGVDALTTSGAGYAKFVDENILRVKAQITGDATTEKDTVDIRFVTTVDTLKYRNVGFEITINGTTNKVLANEVYTQLYAMETTGEVLSLTPAESFCSLSKYFNACTIDGIPNISFGTVITVTACWTTQDGTLVYGEQAKKTINMGIFQTEAVDYGMLLDCDNRDYLSFDAGKAYVTAEDYKEGAGALAVECETGNITLVEFNRGKNAIDISDYADGYLHFWLYVNDTDYLNGSTMIAELSSSGIKDVAEVQWSLPTLQDGWNKICLDFADGEETGKMDYEAVNYFRLSLSPNTCQAGLVIKLDDVRAVASGQIFNCDSMDNYVGNAGTVGVTADEYKEGTGAAWCTGSNSVWYEFAREASPKDISQYSNGRLRFWLYVNNTSYLGRNDVVVELSSAAGADSEELQWNIATSELQSGWNEVALPIAAPDEGAGSIELSAVDYFRISHTNDNTNLVTIVDDVRAVENEAQVIQTLYDTEDVVIADYIPTEMGYAVDPTGATDSTVGIQAALNDCYNAGGGTVYLPAGTYKITDTINIPSYVTLRGDWQDPDSNGDLQYGTIIRVEMATVDETTASQSGVFELEGAGGVVGLTVYYPEQIVPEKTWDIIITTYESPKIYPYTFYVLGGDSTNREMLSTIRNVTVINGYRGIGATTTAAEEHESLQIDNFKGTFLNSGIDLYNSWDVGTVQNVAVNNKYWTQYDSTKDADALAEYTRAKTVGMKLGDVEWSEFSNISIDGCNIGVQTVERKREDTSNVVQFTGSFYDLTITNCNYGVKADYLDTRWGMNIARSSIAGSTYGIANNTSAYIQLCDVSVTGSIKENTSGSVVTDSTDLDTKEIDYATSYTKPDTRMLIANLSEDIALCPEDLIMYITLTITDEMYTYMQTNKGGLSIELAQTTADVNEYNWWVAATSLEKGTNVISLPFSQAGNTEGSPDMREVVNWFRILYSTGIEGEVGLQDRVVLNEVKVVDGTSQVATEWYILEEDTPVTTAWYSDSSCNLQIDRKDASVKLQKTLNWMAKSGGGVVYVPAGTYSFYQPITVPGGVELRGSASIATRDQNDDCRGTLFRCYYGDEGQGMNDTAFITLAGKNAGINGVRILYANNGPFVTKTNASLETSYAIRGQAEGVYVVNSMIAAAAHGVDFRACDNHYIQGVYTCCYSNAFYLGGTGGTITACLQNPTVLERTAAPVSDTWRGDYMFSYLLYSIMKRESHFIILEDAENELVYNNFAYGTMTMLTNIDSANTQVMNIGTDTVGASSAQLVMDGGSLFGVNILYNDTSAEDAVDTTKDGAYLTSGIASKAYKYIAGDLELRNRLQLLWDWEDGERSQPAVTIEHQETTDSGRKYILNCDNVDGIDIVTEGGSAFEVTTVTDEVKEGTGAFKTTGAATTRWNVCLDNPINIAAYKESQLHLKLYINDVNNFTSNSSIYVEIGSSRRCDCEELEWAIPISELKSGWNSIVLNLDDAVSTGIIHLGAIDYFRIHHSGNSDELVTILDDVYVLTTELDLEETVPNDNEWSEWI